MFNEAADPIHRGTAGNQQREPLEKIQKDAEGISKSFHKEFEI
jgi:hypothetical protein